MWQINRPTIAHDWLEFEPEHVLYEYDGPRIFTTKAVTGQLFLAFFCARSPDAIRFLVVPFSEELERRLVTGDINLRDALTRPRMWVFDLDRRWNPIGCWSVTVDELPDRLLPKPGVMLSADLQPIMSRAVAQPSAAEKIYRVPNPRPVVFSGAG